MGANYGRIVFSTQPMSNVMRCDGGNVFLPLVKILDAPFPIVQLGGHKFAHLVNLERGKDFVRVFEFGQELFGVAFGFGFHQPVYRPFIDKSQCFAPRRGFYVSGRIESLMNFAQEGF